ncbi:MAG: preprotein translocase subunit SecE [Proteobacteria bacterium]|nr:preprotein translocase subunit SecE [Pseudomonadota bacterium]
MAQRKNRQKEQTGGEAIEPKKVAGKENGKAAAKKNGPKKAQAKKAEQGPSFIAKTRQFFREVRVELKKVTWPSRKETLASTSVVLVLVFLVAIFLGLVDIALSRALALLVR